LADFTGIRNANERLAGQRLNTVHICQAFEMKLKNGKPNLQKEGNKAKPYQVKQIRNIILKISRE